MAVAQKLQNYLADQDIDYDVIHHTYSEGAVQSAIAAKIPLKNMTKAVVLEDHEGRHLMAIIPANHKLQLKKLSEMVERSLKLAREPEVFEIFSDCSNGAVPAVGAAYQMETVFDDSLSSANDIYVEAGNHEDLIHLNREKFHRLMAGNKHGDMSVTMASPYEHRESGAIMY